MKPSDFPPEESVYRYWDQQREACPVTQDGRLGWVITRHKDLLDALLAPEKFSNVVSSRVSVPSGMDPPTHTPFRKIVEGYFSPKIISDFEPVCRDIAAEQIRHALTFGPSIEAMELLGLPYAATVQCRYLGWPREMERSLLDWAVRNAQAIHELDREALADNARQFEALILGELRKRAEANLPSEADLTARLLHEKTGDRTLTDEERVSILRNWTAGEIGTIAASIGILLYFLGAHPEIQDELRARPERIQYAVGEILRLYGPLLTNRRRTTCPVTVDGVEIPADAPITLHWAAANRDGRVFKDPLTFRWDRDLNKSLLYGAGIHVCPGEPLASLELRLFVEEFLLATRHFQRDSSRPVHAADFPMGGFTNVWITCKPAKA